MATREKTAEGAPDSELVRRLRDSDADAFQTLYFRYYDSLFRYAWYRTSSAESVKDILQDAFTRLWRSRMTLDPDKSVKAYLYRIVHHLVIDLYRKSDRESVFHRDPDSSRPLRDNSEGDADLRMDVRSAIDSLPDDLSETFLLNRHQGLKYSEIAEVLGVSVKTVESRISRALEHLRRYLSR
jgi:RNA polymerase sigma-70 factor, ECF subfamily